MSNPSIEGDLLSAGQSPRRLADQETLWGQFTAASSAEAYCQSWLGLLCAQIERAEGALVLLGSADDASFTPAAVWPDRGRSMVHLTPAAEKALHERRGVVLNAQETGHNASTNSHLAYPLEINAVLRGVVVIEVSARPPAALQEVLRRIHWGMAWLELLFRREDAASDSAARERVFGVLDLVGVAVEEQRFQAACTAVVSELATRLDCDRVSLGLLRGRRMRVEAISHSATFGREMNLVHLLGAAMDEAVDQEATVLFPTQEEDTLVVSAHDTLSQQQGAPQICTVPIPVTGRFEAALTLERPRGREFSPADVEFCEALGELACPILIAKRESERWLIVKALLAAREQLVRLLGGGYLLRKLALASLLAIAAFFAIATGQYRIAADATVEGGRLRAMVAPFNGYIADARFRAGETVAAGTVLATLDDRDLKLEQIRLDTERAQYIRERRQAVAGHDRAQVRILSAQVQQTDAQLELIEEQLARTLITAPFDGIVVSGDLSQSLGAPVQRGDVLFEIAPRGSYRIILKVDERDIDDVREGQQGSMILSALPETPLPLAVSLITPVTTAAEGRNVFTVEATLGEIPRRLRPGMQGVGKIDVGERRLIWIWTRAFVHWLRVKTWTWVG